MVRGRILRQQWAIEVAPQADHDLAGLSANVVGRSESIGRGGALYLFDGEVNINSSNFAANQSAPGADGGAIYAAGDMDVFSIGNTTFQDNVSGDDGGAIYSKPLDSGFVTNTQFIGNRADDTWVAVVLRESNLQFVGSTFTDNTAMHLHGTGSPTDGATGFLSYDSSALFHAIATFTVTTIDGQLVGTPTSVTLSTSLTQAQLNALFAQYSILAQWL